MDRRFPSVALVAAALLIADFRPAGADLIKLKSGGEIRGVIERGAAGANRETVTIETLTGAIIVVEQRHIESNSIRSLAFEQYETRARKTPDTVDAHWKLAEWCLENGLRSQRETHLERVLELDPDHEEANRSLGRVQYQGEWMTRDEMMQAQGYVRHKGRYITPQELEIIEKTQAELDAEREWFPKVRRWAGWLTGRHEDRRRQGLSELRAIDDPSAVPALAKHLQDDSNKQVRALYVSILEEMPGDRPVPALVTQSLQDVDAEIRYNARRAIGRDRYGLAMPLYVRELKNDYNVIVRRAAAALQTVGDETIVPNLVDALTTTHRYRVRVPEPGGNVGFGTDGTFAGGAGQVVLPPELQAMLNSGQFVHGAVINLPNTPRRTRVVTVNYEHKNREVLEALQRLTGESFGFEKRAWRVWWAARKQELGNVD
jgi:hypothetical protein